MVAIGKDLQAVANSQGKALVRQIVTDANNLGIDPNHLQYVFWTLVNEAQWPRFNPVETMSLKLAVSIMNRTGATPNYAAGFSVPDDLTIDSATDEVIKRAAAWARMGMMPALLQGYKGALQKQVRKVPRATGRRVKKDQAFNFLRKAFRQILDLRSRWFTDGELLRRIVRMMPI